MTNSEQQLLQVIYAIACGSSVRTRTQMINMAANSLDNYMMGSSTPKLPFNVCGHGESTREEIEDARLLKVMDYT